MFNFRRLLLWHYLIFKVKQDDCVLIYHSLAYVFPIKVFRFFSNRKIYFEVEELFNAVYSNGELKIEKEKIREIVIISLEENEISLIRIKGKIDPNQMQNIIEDNA